MPPPTRRAFVAEQDEDGVRIEADADVFQTQGLAQEQGPDAGLQQLLEAAAAFGVEDPTQPGGAGASTPVANLGAEIAGNISPEAGQLAGGEVAGEPQTLEGLIEQSTLAMQNAGQPVGAGDALLQSEAGGVPEPAGAPGPAGTEVAPLEGATEVGGRTRGGERDPLQMGDPLSGVSDRADAGGVGVDVNTGQHLTPRIGAAPSGRGGPRASSFIMEELKVRRQLPPEAQAQLALLAQDFQDKRTLAAQAAINGMHGEADALEEEAAKAGAEALAFHEIVDEATSESNEEIRRLRGVLEMMESSRINPDAFWENRGDAARFGASMSVAVQVAVSTILGTPNNAGQIINRAIDRDIQSQIANMENLGRTANARLNMLGAVGKVYKDRMTAIEAYRAIRLAHAATEFAARAERTGATQAQANFLATEAELRNQMGQAAAETWRNQFQTHIVAKQVTSPQRAQRAMQNALGLEQETRRQTARATTARNAARTVQTPQGPQGIGAIITVEQAHALREELHANNMGAVGGRGVPNGMVRIVALENENAVPLSDLENLGEGQGRRLGSRAEGARNYVFDDQAMANMQQTLGPEKAGELVEALSSLEGMRGNMERMVELANRNTFKAGSEWTSADAREAQAIATSMKLSTAQVAQLGALAGPDLELINQIVSNPMDAWSAGDVNSFVRRFASMDRHLRGRIEFFGGEVVDPSGSIQQIDADLGDVDESEPGLLDEGSAVREGAEQSLLTTGATAINPLLGGIVSGALPFLESGSTDE